MRAIRTLALPRLPLFLAYLAASVVCGCASTRDVPPETAASGLAVRQELNEGLAGRSAEILMTSCQRVDAENAQVLGDSLYYTDPVRQQRAGVPLTEVVRVSSRSASEGAKKGALVGLGIWGSVTGLALFASFGSGAGDGPPGAAGAMVIGLITAPVVAVGALVGASAGDERIYRFTDDPALCVGGESRTRGRSSRGHTLFKGSFTAELEAAPRNRVDDSTTWGRNDRAEDPRRIGRP